VWCCETSCAAARCSPAGKNKGLPAACPLSEKQRCAKVKQRLFDDYSTPNVPGGEEGETMMGLR
jgi:hypothetical protein